jgi:hypothetical protein
MSMTTDITSHFAFWVVAAIVGLLLAFLFVVVPFFMFIVAPVMMRKSMLVQPNAYPLQEWHPDDPRWPRGVRWFFGEVWRQVQPLGFKPTAYIAWKGVYPNTILYSAVFDHDGERDSACAMAVESDAGAAGVQTTYVAEFSAESIDGIEVNTNNATEPSDDWILKQRKKILKIPVMRELSMLYECHRLHLASVGVRAKAPLPESWRRADSVRESVFREFEERVEQGAIERVSSEPIYQQRLATAYRLTWSLLPGLVQINRARIRSRARRWLSANGMSPHYDIADYEAMIAWHGGDPTPLPPVSDRTNDELPVAQ